MESIDYEKLKEYLNELCVSFDDEEKFINYVYLINDVARYLKPFLSNIKVENKATSINITYEEVMRLAREIISSIDYEMLPSFDELIDKGYLDFKYDEEDFSQGSFFSFDNDSKIKSIDVERRFNYSDVRVLIHEFFHYYLFKKKTYNYDLLTEFFSIYFEIYATYYLIKEKNIKVDTINSLFRVNDLKYFNDDFFYLTSALIIFDSIGSTDYEDCKDYFPNISKKSIDSLNIGIMNFLLQNEKKNRNPTDLIWKNFRYYLGTILAFYAFKAKTKDDVLKFYKEFNNRENELTDLGNLLIKYGYKINKRNLDIVKESITDYIELLTIKEDLEDYRKKAN